VPTHHDTPRGGAEQGSVDSRLEGYDVDAYLAAMACGEGCLHSAAMTHVEKARKKPPIQSAPRPGPAKVPNV
jgi:hypothetical protein